MTIYPMLMLYIRKLAQFKPHFPSTLLKFPKSTKMCFRKHPKIPFMALSVITFSTLFFISIPKVASLYSLTRLLRSHGLPPGIFPQNVHSFTVDFYGQLTIYLENPCFAWYENMVRFNKVVTANISYRELVGLEGLVQKELFLWLPVKRIKVTDPNSGIIMIDIGVARKEVRISIFDEPFVCTPLPFSTNEDSVSPKEVLEIM